MPMMPNWRPPWEREGLTGPMDVNSPWGALGLKPLSPPGVRGEDSNTAIPPEYYRTMTLGDRPSMLPPPPERMQRAGVRLNKADYDRMPGPSMMFSTEESRRLPSLWSLFSGLFGS